MIHKIISTLGLGILGTTSLIAYISVEFNYIKVIDRFKKKH